MSGPEQRHFEAIEKAYSPFELLKLQASFWPGNPLLILPRAVQSLWGLEKGQWTYAETLREVEALAKVYGEAGYGAGHRVALLFENRPDHFLHWLALNSLGISVVPLNPDYQQEEFGYVLQHSGACLIATVAACSARVQTVAEQLSIAVWRGGPIPPAIRTAPGSTVPSDAQECVLAYTSGTTGKPKGCILSNRYFLTWGTWYVAQRGHISLRAGRERLLTPLPTFHVNAMGNSFFGMLAAGGAQVIVDRFHPRTWLNMARETEATCFHYLGVMPAILLALPETPEDSQHGMRFGLGGGVHPDHHRKFEERFGVPLLEGWTMTEAGGAALLCAAEEPRHIGKRCLGHPGRPGPAMDWRIIDEDGADVSQGNSGEFVVRARGADQCRGFFSGYLNDPVATAGAWADGWFRTGDVFVEGADGQLHFAERKKDIIRRSGENISGAEVEAVLMTHAIVAQVAVVPRPDPLREEEVAAVVVVRNPAVSLAKLATELMGHAAESLAYYKVPGHFVFVSELPTTSTGKLAKGLIREMANSDKSGLVHFDMRVEKQMMRRKSPA